MTRTATSKAQPLATVDYVERLRDELEQLAHDMRLGHPSHQRSVIYADTARSIADRLDDVFRKPSRLVNPPLYVSPEGDRAVW